VEQGEQSQPPTNENLLRLPGAGNTYPGAFYAGQPVRSIPPIDTKLYQRPPKGTVPFVYHTEYDIRFYGLENLHPFDSKKWGKVKEMLVNRGLIREDQISTPQPATDSDLEVAHTKEYLASLQSSYQVASITEVAPVLLLPSFIINRQLIQPFRHHTGGSVLAGKLALEQGWAVNIGGGFHHCCGCAGGGFCMFSDITLTAVFARHKKGIRRVMIVDLDAHQGNGHARDFMGDRDAYILDVYNADIYPQDHDAKSAISKPVELKSGTGDSEYLTKVSQALSEAENDDFSPELIIYNAGTDVLSHDKLGKLDVSTHAVLQRDELVFAFAKRAGSAIVMLTSGGYQQNNAKVIADSICNLHSKGLISL